MKIFRKLLPALSICIVISGQLQAQDIHFSQFYENGSMRNPALVGILSGDYKAGVTYRNQWGALSVPYTTALVSYETKIMVNREVQDYVSFGVTGISYKAGKAGFSTTAAYGTISYNKSLEDANRTYLSFGFTGAYLQRSFDPAKMTFSNQYQAGTFDPNNASNESFKSNSSTSYDVGAGVSLNGTLGKEKTSNYYIGAAAYNIVTAGETYLQNTSYTKRPLRFTGNLGLKVSISSFLGFVIHANYQNQSPYQETVLGALITMKNKVDADKNTWMFSYGCFYRVNDAIIPTVKLEYQNWALGFSYDYGKAGKFGRADFGGYELSLYVKGFYKHKRNYNELKCPMFEEMIFDNR